MKRFLVIAVFSLLVILNVLGQTWYPIGAEWYFNQQILLDYPAHGYTKYTVESDTIIASKNAKKIIRKTYDFHTGIADQGITLFISEENSKVFRWAGTEYKIMYDFTLGIGDTLALDVKNLDCDSITPITVDSIGIENVMGKNLKVQYVSYTEFWPYGDPKISKISDKIFEKIGRVEEFIYSPVCRLDSAPWEILLLRCYEDSEISFKSDWWLNYSPNAPCDTLIDGTVGIKSNELTEEIKLYPNPCTDLLNIDSPTSKIISVILFNSLGRSFVGFKPEKYFFQLDTAPLLSGIYYVQIITENSAEIRTIIKL